MPERYSDKMVANLLPSPLNIDMATWVSKRKAEYVAGRYLAKQALNYLDARYDIVKTGKNREPIWPQGFVGSISHTGTTVICAVSSVNDHQRIGLDIERIMAKKTVLELHDIVLVSQEYPLVRRDYQLDVATFTAIFSAKESLYKALYPEVKRYFDFLDAMVTQMDLQQGRFSIQLLQTLTPELKANLVFKGQVFINQNHIITSIID
ncbi:4'-phosphopantetheinyl transferase family protein [Aliivibrio fischeri]|nr:4'-phosphopantetheinyl transferase superfamily protein [Aliivibrio fischeri]